MFHNIPQELRAIPQWVCWRSEYRPPMLKPTKTPYNPAGYPASVTKPQSWATFESVASAPLTCVEPVSPEAPVSQTGFSGIGFVFTAADPYAFIDLDDTHGDAEAYAAQVRIYQQFNSYSELSPSGQGCHIIVKGQLPHGKRRGSVEIYSCERYATMTGQVINNVGIAERQELLTTLFNEMGGVAHNYTVSDQPQQYSDEQIIEMGLNAVNGDKFKSLHEGNWEQYYQSQSEADFAYVDMLAFYSRNTEQIKRMFRASPLGQRDKAKRDDYLHYMVQKSFDNQLPQVDITGLQAQLAAFIAEGGAAASTTGQGIGAAAPLPDGGSKGSAIGTSGHVMLTPPAVNNFPPGLLGEIAQFIYEASPRPVASIALAGAIALLAGITGRAYNISGTGLNQYVILLAQTGTGKDAMADGISKLIGAVQKSVPAAGDFKGPGELVSSAGLIKWLKDKPSIVCILGEFGKKLKEMASPGANAYLTGVSRVLLQMYSKSGINSVFDPMAYSDKEKNTHPIYAPALTLLCETVPETFYELMDENVIADGLLPRFMVFEYKGERAYLNKSALAATPSFSLVQRLADVAANCLKQIQLNMAHDVYMPPEVAHVFDEYDKMTTDNINNSQGEVQRHLWNRAHLKALKLASLQAVGQNYINPVITIEAAQWAIALVTEQVTKLIAKFDTGAIGVNGGGESKQVTEVVRVIRQYMTSPFDKVEKYGVDQSMHFEKVITESYISRRLITLAAFRNDKLGSTAAIKRTIKSMLDADELREVPPKQMLERYGSKPRAFVVANGNRFIGPLAE